MPGQGHVIFLLMAGVVACGSDTSTTGGIPVQIEDSAGVRIVEYVSVPEVEPPFAFAAEPRYRHGANQGDYAFQGAGAGRLFPDGRRGRIRRVEHRTGRVRPRRLDVPGARHGGRGTRGSGLRQGHVRAGAGQHPGG